MSDVIENSFFECQVQISVPAFNCTLILMLFSAVTFVFQTVSLIRHHKTLKDSPQYNTINEEK